MKFYVHHYYSYELFWYFFHGAEIKENPPAWFWENRYNKNVKIVDKVSIKCRYKGNDIDVIFAKEENWDKDDGFHMLDYSIKLIEEGYMNDRGWNGDIGHNRLPETIDFLLKHKSKKIIFFYINWEPCMETEQKQLSRLNGNILFFVDDNSVKYSKNQKFSHSHILSSYLFPDTIGLKNFYFFGNYLKYKNDFKYRLNFPVRRIHVYKTDIVERLKKLNNKYISVSLSSFTDYGQHETNIEKTKYKLNSWLKKYMDVYIEKRGYNIQDFGGEWNWNNMNEFLWKMFGISDINLIYETWQRTHINEKSISHILAGKPFIPCRYNTIQYYEDMCRKYGLEYEEYPLQYYDYIFDIMDTLDEIIKNDEKYEVFLSKLKRYVLKMRENYIEIIHNNNDVLDLLINKNDNKSTSLI